MVFWVQNACWNLRTSMRWHCMLIIAVFTRKTLRGISGNVLKYSAEISGKVPRNVCRVKTAFINTRGHVFAQRAKCRSASTEVGITLASTSQPNLTSTNLPTTTYTNLYLLLPLPTLISKSTKKKTFLMLLLSKSKGRRPLGPELTCRQWVSHHTVQFSPASDHLGRS